MAGRLLSPELAKVVERARVEIPARADKALAVYDRRRRLEVAGLRAQVDQVVAKIRERDARGL